MVKTGWKGSKCLRETLKANIKIVVTDRKPEARQRSQAGLRCAASVPVRPTELLKGERTSGWEMRHWTRPGLTFHHIPQESKFLFCL